MTRSSYVIIKDDIDAPDWYCAQVLKVLPDRVKVAWLITKVAPLTDYKNKSMDKRLARLKGLRVCENMDPLHGHAHVR